MSAICSAHSRKIKAPRHHRPDRATGQEIVLYGKQDRRDDRVGATEAPKRRLADPLLDDGFAEGRVCRRNIDEAGGDGDDADAEHPQFLRPGGRERLHARFGG
jgi:hypothetical protein